MHNNPKSTTLVADFSAAPSVLASLRQLVPQREATFLEALRVAEQQSQRFLHRLGIHDGPVSEELLLDMPRITIESLEAFEISGIGESVEVHDRFTGRSYPVEDEICADETGAACYENHSGLAFFALALIPRPMPKYSSRAARSPTSCGKVQAASGTDDRPWPRWS